MKNKIKIGLAKINYDVWKRQYFLRFIDLLWNSLIICLVIVFWKNGTAYAKGVSITLFFILVMSYLKEIKNIFKS